VLSYPEAFRRLAAELPDAVAVVCDAATASRAELESASNRRARGWQRQGVEAGDHIAIALPNGIAFVECALGAWKLGAVPVPLSARLPEKEQREIVALADPRLVIGVPDGRYPDRITENEASEAPAAEADTALEDRVSPHCQAIASGGSTGRPKLIVDANPASFDTDAPHYGLEEGGAVLIPGPLFHTGPFLNARESLLRGGLVVLMSRFDPERALQLIDVHQVEWVNLVPTMLHRMWRLPEEVRTRYALTSLRRVVSSGAACADWLMRSWIEWIGPDRMFEVYGGTERIGGTMISGREWLERPGSVGKPTGGRLVRILGDDGQELAAGEVGEVYFLPPGGQGSTYRYVGADARATSDGWETLGDMGSVDEDGYLYLVDRRTDMVVTGGENVYPAEVEAAIDGFPSVAGSCVIGLPDEDLGQRLHAIVEADSNCEPALRARLEQELVRYKIPRSFEFVSEPIRDDAGKVRRAQLRAQRIAT
jgi:bile acid-coenzyme A ligase